MPGPKPSLQLPVARVSTQATAQDARGMSSGHVMCGAQAYRVGTWGSHILFTRECDPMRGEMLFPPDRGKACQQEGRLTHQGALGQHGHGSDSNTGTQVLSCRGGRALRAPVGSIHLTRLSIQGRHGGFSRYQNNPNPCPPRTSCLCTGSQPQLACKPSIGSG